LKEIIHHLKLHLPKFFARYATHYLAYAKDTSNQMTNAQNSMQLKKACFSAPYVKQRYVTGFYLCFHTIAPR
jgi:hypothetical protein